MFLAIQSTLDRNIFSSCIGHPICHEKLHKQYLSTVLPFSLNVGFVLRLDWTRLTDLLALIMS